MAILWFILILGGIVLVHEFGHFIFSKLFGVYVYEFSIGMGPKLLHHKKKGGETEYCIRAIPIGGFVSLAGEDADDNTKIDKKRMYYLCRKTKENYGKIRCIQLLEYSDSQLFYG